MRVYNRKNLIDLQLRFMLGERVFFAGENKSIKRRFTKKIFVRNITIYVTNLKPKMSPPK